MCRITIPTSKSYIPRFAIGHINPSKITYAMTSKRVPPSLNIIPTILIIICAANKINTLTVGVNSHCRSIQYICIRAMPFISFSFFIHHVPPTYLRIVEPSPVVQLSLQHIRTSQSMRAAVQVGLHLLAVIKITVYPSRYNSSCLTERIIILPLYHFRCRSTCATFEHHTHIAQMIRQVVMVSIRAAAVLQVALLC